MRPRRAHAGPFREGDPTRNEATGAGKRANALERQHRHVSNDSSAPGADEQPGERIGDVVERIRARREESEERGTGESDGVIADQLDVVENRLLSFGRALGGEIDDVSELPFTEEAAQDEMPSALYVRHDEVLLNQVTSWLLQDQHIGLVSPYGTGKTAFREVALRDLRAHDDFVVAHVENPRDTTPRQLYGEMLEAAYEAGYELDTAQFTQARDGIPWATDEARQAVRQMAEEIRADDRRPLLIVDEIEVLPAELLSPLQTAGDAGVRLFLLGTPEGKDRIANLRGTLDSRLRYYEGIEPFDADAVEEYVERSLAYMRGERYDGQDQTLFTRDAIEDVAERSGGNAREVRIECRELFTRAAFVWDRTGQSIDRIQVTPQLRHRRFGMDG
ncbi:hypothetical protein GCM10028857_27150 [Salinarchaeum chitinilyticum]